MNSRLAMSLAALLFAIGVIIGALGSHALTNVLAPQQLASLGTAVDYQLFNALGLLVVGLLMHTLPAARLRLIAWALLLGIIFFSGGIYVMLAGAPKFLGYITPLGGVMLILAWLALTIVLWRSGR
ncbi:MAG: DUF423 domain-containing protein [Pseudomonadota bacterium]